MRRRSVSGSAGAKNVHSRYADPLFVAPEEGDFRLKPESPAFALRFQPFAGQLAPSACVFGIRDRARLKAQIPRAPIIDAAVPRICLAYIVVGHADRCGR